MSGVLRARCCCAATPPCTAAAAGGLKTTGRLRATYITSYLWTFCRMLFQRARHLPLFACRTAQRRAADNIRRAPPFLLALYCASRSYVCRAAAIPARGYGKDGQQHWRSRTLCRLAAVVMAWRHGLWPLHLLNKSLLPHWRFSPSISLTHSNSNTHMSPSTAGACLPASPRITATRRMRRACRAALLL